jgi:hypothetical protein
MAMRVFLTLIVICVASLATAAASDGNLILPSKACDFLARDGFKPNTPYHHYYDEEWGCGSSYVEIGTGSPLPNNIAYYVSGTQDKVEKLYLVINVNDRGQAIGAHKRLLAAAHELLKASLGQTLPEEAATAIENGQPKSWVINGAAVEVKRDDWPTGKGYEVHFIIRPV